MNIQRSPRRCMEKERKDEILSSGGSLASFAKESVSVRRVRSRKEGLKRNEGKKSTMFG